MFWAIIRNHKERESERERGGDMKSIEKLHDILSACLMPHIDTQRQITHAFKYTIEWFSDRIP